MTNIRPVQPNDAETWLQLRQALWPNHTREAHAAEIADFLAGTRAEPLAVLLAEDAMGKALGFAELSIRPYAEGCVSDRVAYLEGWYVVPGARARGIGQALVEAAAAWARQQQCTELASDTELTNEASAAAHRALGFTEVAQVRCFRMVLDGKAASY